MKTITLIFCLSLLNQISFSQLLPSSRRVQWELAGHRGDFSEPENIVDFLESGGSPDGIASNNVILADILSNSNGEPIVVYFPKGTYLFSESVHLKSNVILRGESVDSTVLLFNLSSADHLISIIGEATTVSTSLISDGIKDSSIVDVYDPGSFSRGDHVYLLDDDSRMVTSTWAQGTTGQMLQIQSVFDGNVSFTSPLRRDFSVQNDPQLVKLQPVVNTGIEMLTIKRMDKNNEQTSNIFFQYTSNCWLKCIKSINCNFAHVDIRYSTNTHITGGYFRGAFSHGGGGKAYGVILHFATGESLITENVFEHLRHSMILQAGANGNVLSYNYSADPYWTGVALPSNAAGDIVLHGNYPYANLFEGNTVQNIVIDNSHGINGKFNTFFRNRAELYGIIMNNNPASDEQNFIGNEITNTSFLKGNYLLSGKGHFEYGNVKSGIVLPSGTQNLNEASLYMRTAPEYYLDHSSWPPIGLPNKMKSNKIMAEDVYLGNIPSACSNLNTVLTSIQHAETVNLNLFPNPATEIVRIELEDPRHQHISNVQILSANGTLLLNSEYNEQIDLRDLSAGMYFVRITFSNNVFTVRKLIKKGT